MILDKFFRAGKERSSRVWSKGRVIGAIVNELRDLNPVRIGDNLIFNGQNKLKVSFVANNFAEDKNIELNASINFVHEGEEYNWFDLFHLAKIYFGDDYKALTIPKNKSWEGSSIQNECRLFYAPLITILLNKEDCRRLLRGEKVTRGRFSFQISKEGYSLVLDIGADLLRRI